LPLTTLRAVLRGTPQSTLKNSGDITSKKKTQQKFPQSTFQLIFRKSYFFQTYIVWVIDKVVKNFDRSK
jgi:hypothetical protein